MSKLPKIVLEAWETRVKVPVVTTVDKKGVPNSIYVTFAAFYDDEKVLVADNKFDKTLKNVADGCKGSVLFLTEAMKAYQIKGTFSYETSGKYFDDMKKWNREDLPGKGVAILEVEAIYSGAERIEF